MAYQTRTSWGLDSRGEDWRDSAACLPGNNVNPEWFFNEGYGADATRFNNAAKMVCLDCPVKDDCLDYAMGAGVTDGIFGGLTPHERKLLRAPGRNHLGDTCRSGRHAMDGSNVGWSRNGRFCRACRAQSTRNFHDKRAVSS